MARAGWIDENSNRDFPFVSKPNGVDNAAVVDFGCIFSPEANFIEGTNSVWLSAVIRSGATFTFVFNTDASGCTGSLTFTRNIADIDVETSSEIYSAGDSSLPLWEAFLITGRLDKLATDLAEGSILTHGIVEPALIQSLLGTRVNSLNVANMDRTRVPNVAEDCDCYLPSVTTHSIWVWNSEPLIGDVRLEAGYNCNITQREDLGIITIGAAIGDGAGEPCTEVKVGPTETKNGTLYDNSPTCAEVIRSVNGVGGRILQLVAGAGVTLEMLPTQNKIKLTVDTRGLASC